MLCSSPARRLVAAMAALLLLGAACGRDAHVAAAGLIGQLLDTFRDPGAVRNNQQTHHRRPAIRTLCFYPAERSLYRPFPLPVKLVAALGIHLRFPAALGLPIAAQLV